MTFYVGHPVSATEFNNIVPSTTTTFTPSWTDLTAGTGATNEGEYMLLGRFCIMRTVLVFGTSPAISGIVLLNLPSGLEAETSGVSNGATLGTWTMKDNNVTTGFYGGAVVTGSSSSTASLVLTASAGRVTTGSPITTIASSDRLALNLTYLIA